MNGGYRPVPNDLVLEHFRTRRPGPYSRAEAFMSWDLDRHRGKVKSLRGYGRIWGVSDHTAKAWIQGFPLFPPTAQQLRTQDEEKQEVAATDCAPAAQALRTTRRQETRDKRRDQIPQKESVLQPASSELATATKATVYFGHRLSEWMPGAQLPSTPKQLQVWTKQMDLLHRKDGAEWRDIRAVIDWLAAGADEDAVFWQGNIHSTAKLRKQFAVLMHRRRGGKVSNEERLERYLEEMRNEPHGGALDERSSRKQDPRNGPVLRVVPGQR